MRENIPTYSNPPPYIDSWQNNTQEFDHLGLMFLHKNQAHSAGISSPTSCGALISFRPSDISPNKAVLRK